MVRTDRSIFHPKDDGREANQPCLQLMKRILVAYVSSDSELDYVQGMNDFLSPIVYVFTKDSPIETMEHLVYWAFAELMCMIVLSHFSNGSVEKQFYALFRKY